MPKPIATCEETAFAELPSSPNKPNRKQLSEEETTSHVFVEHRQSHYDGVTFFVDLSVVLSAGERRLEWNTMGLSSHPRTNQNGSDTIRRAFAHGD